MKMVWLDRVARYLNIIGTAAIALIMLITVTDVFLRFVFEMSIVGLYDVSTHFLLWVLFLGFAYVESVGGNVKANVLPRLPAPVESILGMFTNCLFLLVFGVLTWHGTLLTVEAWQMNRQTGQELQWMPVFIFFAAIPIGGFALCLNSAAKIIKCITKEFIA